MFDGELLFSNKQAVSGAADSDNILAVGRDIGGGTPLYLEVDCLAVAGATLAVTMKHGDAEDMSDGAALASWTVAPEALAKGGCVLSAAVPAWNKKYLQLAFAGSGSLTLTAGITTSRQTAAPQGYGEEYA